MVSQLDEYKQALCKLGADSISGHRRRRWPNIKTTLCQCLVFSGTKAQCRHWAHVLCTTHSEHHVPVYTQQQRSDTTVLIYDTKLTVSDHCNAIACTHECGRTLCLQYGRPVSITVQPGCFDQPFHYIRFFRPSSCWQLGQKLMWMISLHRLTHKGIRQHPRSHLKQRTHRNEKTIIFFTHLKLWIAYTTSSGWKFKL